MNSDEVEQLLGERGPFAVTMPGFSVRPEQQAMAAAVHRAIVNRAVLVCEAGTGTGKTLAYLCAALVAGRKTIVSTGTKNLQDQLHARDLPGACDALGLRVKSALLKGRANYLCSYRLDLTEQDPPHGHREQHDMVSIRAWATRTATGDRAECAEVPEDSAIWPRVTSTVENCVGADCPRYDDCHVLGARKRAADADVVIVNHHLFFADMALREEGFGEVLPGAEVVIFDEAHQLPEVASQFFGLTLSSTQVRDLGRDVLLADAVEAGDAPDLPMAVARAETACAGLRLCFGNERSRVAWVDVAPRADVQAAVAGFARSISHLVQQLESLAERGPGLESCHRRAAEIERRLTVLRENADHEQIRWIECHSRAFSWHMTPLEIASIFASHIESQLRAWVFTSATLSVAGTVSHFSSRLGLADYESAVWASPFDYRHQALCYVPENLPVPGGADYTEAVVQASLPLLRASAGRAFLLFTSHAALRRAAEILAARAKYALLVQGTAPREQLLRDFRVTSNAVLLGTSSFWEGVDVRGAALVCVIIDKLPFAAPDDPVLRARMNALKEKGCEPFMSYQLPQAIIALKQGVGRLIRDEADCGALVLCDPRIYSRGYGKLFRESLPPMRYTRSEQETVEFLTHV